MRLGSLALVLVSIIVIALTISFLPLIIALLGIIAAVLLAGLLLLGAVIVLLKVITGIFYALKAEPTVEGRPITIDEAREIDREEDR
ncbi:MAG: hypothetical protein J7J65_04935 [Candidatus Korarchaeota archaeon]|nr:hypothetical protein [Candidatus Korarchaeota archaeon]